MLSLVRKPASSPLLLIVLLLAAVPAAGGEDALTALDQHGNRRPYTPQPGAVTIVDFAASWCGPCHETLPRLQALADEHAELRVLVISVDDSVDGRDALVESLGLEVPVLWDEGKKAAEHYRPESMPATFVFDARGEPVLKVNGSRSEDWKGLVATVEKLLADPSARPAP